MSEWLGTSLLTLLRWGVWGFLSKLVTGSAGWQHAFAIASLAVSLVVIAFYAAYRPSLGSPSTYALLAGAAGAAGVVLYYVALSRGKASMVVPLAALYPAVATVPGKKEKVTGTQGVGILLAVISIFLISL